MCCVVYRGRCQCYHLYISDCHQNKGVVPRPWIGPTYHSALRDTVISHSGAVGEASELATNRFLPF